MGKAGSGTWKWPVTIFSDFRSDNCLKNHFYSTLRRITRLLDKFIRDEKKNYRQMVKNKQDIPERALYEDFDKIRGI
jgi:hypothetical protein